MLGRDEDTDSVAVVARSQSRAPIELTFGDLREQVARARAGLQRLGVGPGDRVVAYLPNIPETLVAFLATASLGAVWATCPPEFGTRSVISRLGQLEPTVLLAVAGYRYGEQARRSPRAGGRRPRAPALAADGRARSLRGRRRRHPSGRGRLGRATGRVGAARVRARCLRAPAVRALLVGHDGAAEGDRARPRRHPHRAPEEPHIWLGPPCRRPTPVVHDDRVDDVERARLGAAHARLDRHDRRRPGLSRPRPSNGSSRRRRGRRSSGSAPRSRWPAARRGSSRDTLRPVVDPHALHRRLAAAAGGLRVAVPAGWLGRLPQRRHGGHGCVHGPRAGLPAAAGIRR